MNFNNHLSRVVLRTSKKMKSNVKKMKSLAKREREI